MLLSVCVYSKRSVNHQYCETTDTHLSFYCKSYSSYYTAHTTSHVFLCLVKDPPPAEVKLLTPGVAEAGRAATSVTLIPYLVVLPNVVLASGKRDHLLNYTFDPVRTCRNSGLYVFQTALSIWHSYQNTVEMKSTEVQTLGAL